MMSGYGASQDSLAGDLPQETRQRLRPWLISQLDGGVIHGLEWVDRKSMKFKIPWKHGGKQDWDPKQAQIFKEWAVHTGKFREGVDQSNYAKWKTNLRCALNKAPDIQEVSELTRKDEPNPYKVYRFLEKRKRGSVPINVPSDDYGPVDHTAADGGVIPQFVKDYCSTSSTLPSDEKPGNIEPMFACPGEGARLPSDLGNMDSGDLFKCPVDDLPSEDSMDTGEPTQLNGIMQFANHGPPGHVTFENDTQTSAYCPLDNSTADLMPNLESKYTPPLFTVEDLSTQQQQPLSAQLVYSRPPNCVTTTTSQPAVNLAVKPETLVPFDKFMPSHTCRPSEGCDMYLEILYRNYIINNYHISSRSKGCRITHHTGATALVESALPDTFRDALYGTDSQQRQTVALPAWPAGLCAESLLPSITDLLTNMQRGLILECKHGDILATRLCKTTVYYSSSFVCDATKLVRHDNSIQVTKIFDIENDFKPALTQYERGEGRRPSPYVYLYIGQKGSEATISSLLIVVRLTSCRALQLVTEVDDKKCSEQGMEISQSNEFDRFGENVARQLEHQQQLPNC